MRKVLSIVLVGLGAFLLVAAIVALTWVPGQVQRTPLDTDDITYLSGSATILGEEGPVKAFSTSKIDSNKSTDKVAVWSSTLCVVWDRGDIDGCVDDTDPDGRLITAEDTQFATDRHTAMTVDNDGFLPKDTLQMEGLQNKWPFNTEKKTYPVWDDIVGSAVDAKYQGEDTLDGLDVYVFQYDVSVGPVNLIMDINGTYNATNTYYIEPRTGQIIKQVVHQERVAQGVEPILELDLEFTDDQVQANVDNANDNIAQLDLLGKTVPLVGFIVGIPAILIGLALIFLGRRKAEGTPAGDRTKEPAGV